MPTPAAAQARIAKAIAEAKARQGERQHALEVAVQELASLEEQERDLRVEVDRVEGKREWMEGFRLWVETLGIFLEEKASTHRNILLMLTLV